MWLNDLRLILPDRVVPRGAVRVEDGRIADVREGAAPAGGIDGRGLTLMPGMIDLHGDMIEKEAEPRPGASFPLPVAVAELDRRLAVAGVTTAYAGVSFAESRAAAGGLRSEEKAGALVEAVCAARGELLVDLRVHARFEVTNPRAEPVLRDLVDRGRVHLVSLTDHTPGQGQYRQVEHYVAYQVRAYGRDAGEVEAAARARMAERAETPLAWEVAQGVTALARSRGVPIASHDDDTPEKVRVMHRLGATISEFPVTVAAAAEARHLGLCTLMGAPNALRGGSMTGNISALTLAEAGLLDALAADYHQGAMLPAAFAYARDGVMALPGAVALVTANAARAVGLTDRGAIAAGQRADLVLVEDLPGAPPRVRATIRGGRPIFSDGTCRLDALGDAR